MTYIKKHFVFVLLFSALSMNSRLAYADEIVSAKEPEAILNVAKGFGSASLDRDSDGDPMIIGRVEGTKYVIFFYGGNNVNQGKEDIKFYAYWNKKGVPLSEINNWNSNKRFGKASIDKDGDTVLTMDVNLKYGVTAKNLEDTFLWWKAVILAFTKEVIN